VIGYILNIPPGYTLIQEGSVTAAVRGDYCDGLVAQGITRPEFLMAQAKGEGCRRSGRGDVACIPVQGREDENMIIRKYLRGGFVRVINRDVYIGRERPLRELAATARAAAQGIPAPVVLAAVSVKAAGPLYRGYLISRELSGCIDLPSYLSQAAQKGEAAFADAKRAALQQAAALVRRMHDAGLYHGDLNMKNILINTAAPECLFIIDWDKSRDKTTLSVTERSENLLRLCRSMLKLARRGLPVTDADAAFFLEACGQGRLEVQQNLQRLHRSVSARKLLWRLSGQ